MAMALGSRANTTAPTRPRHISEKYSAGPNLKATSASGGAKAASSSSGHAAGEERTQGGDRQGGAGAALRAIWCPSSTVTTAEVSPGSATGMAVVDPPYWAP